MRDALQANNGDAIVVYDRYKSDNYVVLEFDLGGSNLGVAPDPTSITIGVQLGATSTYGREYGRLHTDIIEGAEKLYAGSAIHRGVVHLEVQGETPGWYTFNVIQSLYHIRFPQWSGSIEWARVQARRLNTELPPISRLR